jgi:hypothetical protein
MTGARIIPFPNLASLAPTADVSVTAGASLSPKPACASAVTTSFTNPVPVPPAPVNSTASGSSQPVSRAGSGVVDFSDCEGHIDSVVAASRRDDELSAWLLLPGARELPAMLSIATASRTLAAKANVSKSISLVKA